MSHPTSITKHAGFQRRWVWPIRVAAGGSVEAVDVAATLTAKVGAASTATAVAVVEASAGDPEVGTVTVTLTVPDDHPAGVYVLRLDVDQAGGEPLDNADGIAVTILPASAQRTAP